MQASIARLQYQSHTCADSSFVQSHPSALSALSVVVAHLVGFCCAEGGSCGPGASSLEEQQRELLVEETRRIAQHWEERTV